MMKQTLKFEIELDENNLPLNIEMHASDRAADENNIKALMVSAWAAKPKKLCVLIFGQKICQLMKCLLCIIKQ